MRYTNKDVLAIRDHANLLLKKSGSADELFLTISQSMWQIWSRNGKEEVMLVDYSTNDQAHRWFEGFNVAMSYAEFRPNLNTFAKPVEKKSTIKMSAMGKLIGFFNHL